MAVTTNAGILNAIRSVASNDYQKQVPVATDIASYNNILSAMTSDEILQPVANEFLSILFNKILVQRVYDPLNWKTPFSVFFKSGGELGDTEELITLDVKDGVDYTEVSSLLTVNKPKVLVAYVYTTSRKKYSFSFNENILRGAICKEYGIANMLAICMKRMQDKDSLYIYNQTLKDFTKIANETIVGAIGTVTPIEDCKKVYTKILEVALNMEIPSTKYNVKDILMATPKGNAYLVLNANYKANFDVNIMASLFNSNYIDSKKYFKDIIVANFNDINCIGYIVDESGYLIIPRIKTTTSFYDGSNMITNTWLHSWIKQGLNPFAQSCKLMTVATEYTITNESVTGGSTASKSGSIGGTAITKALSGSEVFVTATATSGYTVTNVSVTSKDGSGVEVRTISGGYVFTMPSGNVNIKGTFTANGQ